MNSGAIFLAALAFNLQDAVFAQSTSSPPSAISSQTGSGSVNLPSISPTPATSTTMTSTSSTTMTSNSSTTMTSNSSTTMTSTSTEPPTDPKTPGKETCGKTRVTLKDKNARLNKTTMEGLFDNSSIYESANVSAYKNETGEEQIKITFTLCLVQIPEGVVIEEYLKMQLGKVINASSIGAVEFDAQGVTLENWKAKEDECKKCSEGGGGPFAITRKCTEGNNSCRGVKVNGHSSDCLKYCDDSGRVTIAGSSLIVSAGIALSLSLYLWE